MDEIAHMYTKSGWLTVEFAMHTIASGCAGILVTNHVTVHAIASSATECASEILVDY